MDVDEKAQEGLGVPGAYRHQENLARLRDSLDREYQHYRREHNLWGKSVQIDYLMTIFKKRSEANAAFMVWYGRDIPTVSMIRALRKAWGVEKVQQIFSAGGAI